jgi:acyl carrier protein
MPTTALHTAVLEAIRPFIKKDPDGGEPAGSASLVQDLGIDSGRFVEIILLLEQRFNLTFEDSAIDRLRTLDDITAYIQSHGKA